MLDTVKTGKPAAAWRFARLGLGVASLSSLAACADFQGDLSVTQPVVNGPVVSDNKTPLDAALSCYGAKLAEVRSAPLSIGVGAVRDYTGKMNDTQGKIVTQGASPMLFSALYKLGGAVQVHERFDTQVAELELAYQDKRRLGDGDAHEVEGQTVPWKPYYGGTIEKSDFYIVGGITELNYNIRSGGGEMRVNQIGPKARKYTMNVAADLRVVNTSSLVVESATSVQKQIVGYEVGFELFRFFGGSDNLVDINVGEKNAEPLQLGVRSTLEFGLMRLLADVSGVQYEDCLPVIWQMPPERIKPGELSVAADVEAALERQTAGEVVVTKLRVGRHSDFFRTVIELSGDTPRVIDERGRDLVVTLPKATTPESTSVPAPPAGAGVEGLSMSRTENGLEIRVSGERDLGLRRVFTMPAISGAGIWLVVDVEETARGS